METNGHEHEGLDPQLADLDGIPIGTRVEFLDAQVLVSRARNPANRVITILDSHSATAYTLELTPDACRAIGGVLSAVVPVAGPDDMPPDPPRPQ